MHVQDSAAAGRGDLPGLASKEHEPRDRDDLTYLARVEQ
jgi:hypothetical protein